MKNKILFIVIGIVGGLLLSGLVIFILIKNDVIFIDDYESDDNFYLASFDSDGGTEIKDIVIECGVGMELPEEPTKEGYKFLYWIDEADNAIVPENSFLPCDDVNLKAIWEKVDEPKNDINNINSKNFINISVDEYLEIMKKNEKSIIYIARPNCSWCQKQYPILNNLMNQYNLNIYYLNTENFYDLEKQDYTEDGYKLINSSEKYKDGYGTPNTIIVQNGKIVDGIFGYVEEKDLKELFISNGFVK